MSFSNIEGVFFPKYFDECDKLCNKMIDPIGEKVDDNTYYDTAYWSGFFDNNNLVRF